MESNKPYGSLCVVFSLSLSKRFWHTHTSIIALLCIYFKSLYLLFLLLHHHLLQLLLLHRHHHLLHLLWIWVCLFFFFFFFIRSFTHHTQPALVSDLMRYLDGVTYTHTQQRKAEERSEGYQDEHQDKTETEGSSLSSLLSVVERQVEGLLARYAKGNVMPCVICLFLSYSVCFHFRSLAQ